ncbi:MAG: DUF4280 domain-containing protein [Myxococcota bacterium]|nr:DUF4280 domain-containing protein [Myxococcota bacterium]MEC8379001.1 DUF4280 domain-containing protein [Myxococcota bacterium]
MPLHVVDGATLKCTLGTAPAKLKVVRPSMMIMGKKEANIMDNKPKTNILPFGKCKCGSCMSIKACVPNTTGPWIQIIPSVIGRSDVSLLQPATIKCSHGGTISIVNPGQQKQSANPPKETNVNLKTEATEKLFEVDTGSLKVDGALKGELATNPAANQSLNVSNMQASMSQNLNGATLNLNSAGVPEISLANGQSMTLGNPSFAPATNGLGMQTTFPLGEVPLANGATMNTSFVVTATVNPLNVGLGTIPVPALTPAQLQVLAQTGAGIAAGTAAFGGNLLKNLLLPMAAGGI